MVRLEYLFLENHPQLGTLELSFSELSEEIFASKPYTSLLIGPNGTGKSFLLKTIAEIFRQFYTYSISGKRKFTLPFDFHLRYKFQNNIYEIVTSKPKVDERGTKREYAFFKDRPLDSNFLNNKNLFNKTTLYDIPISDIKFPEKLLVNSLMLTDRFVFQNSKETDFYQYLGVRSTSGSTSTKSSSRKTIKHLFNAVNSKTDFAESLRELLSFLDFDPSFEISYTTKINKLFFSGKLTVENFKQYFEYWWDESFVYTTRKQDNPLWSVPYYNNNFRESPEKMLALVNYLNNLSNGDILQHKRNSDAKILKLDLLNKDRSSSEWGMIAALESLDILNLQGIMLKKLNSNLSTSELSSGEYHLIISLIGIFSNICDNSIILIDEPEISLHPNWQMRYISFLKKVFHHFPSCHFIITTHSHFLISDLEGDSSSVTALERGPDGKITTELLYGKNTFGWSAEEVLYKVFKVKTTRNFYLEADLRELLHKIAVKSQDQQRMFELLIKLKNLSLNDNDPLKLIISRAEQYLIK